MVSVAGIVVARLGSGRRYLVWLLLPVGDGLPRLHRRRSGYNYDRFVLPVCFVLALFGGLAIDRVVGGATRTAMAIAGVAAVFAYSLPLCGHGRRPHARRLALRRQALARGHATADDVIGSCFGSQYLPDLHGYRNPEICTPSDLDREFPRFFVQR